MIPDLPTGWRLDPACEQVMAERGIWWVITDTGLRTAWNGSDSTLICPVCVSDPEEMPDCAECVGRGVVTHVPFAERPWDEVYPGLWLGGHDCQPSMNNPGGACPISSEFDFVVSLYSRHGYGPDEGVEHITYRISDSDLEPEHHSGIDELARIVAEAVEEGQNVLVRCQAGLNRSSLVVALAMLRLGCKAEPTIQHLRDVRSPYVLCNQSFVDYILSKENQ